MHPIQANPQVTENAFEFLLERGFALDERWMSLLNTRLTIKFGSDRTHWSEQFCFSGGM